MHPIKGALLAGAALCAVIPAHALADEAADAPTTVSGIDISPAPADTPVATTPASRQSVTAETLRLTTQLQGPEDAVKYLPSLLVRRRHPGDTQAPLATRTSGVGASARSLIFVDGAPLSALIGNNNSSASPRWSLVAPEEIARVDVLYGPFSAAYGGNSIGAVVDITTRDPQGLEGSFKIAGAWDDFSHDGHGGTYPSTQLAATLGDRIGDVSWFAAANHLQARSQPLSYVTAARPASPGGAGAPTTGAVADVNRTGAPIVVLGAGGLEDQAQDTLKLKLAWSPGGALRISWLGGLFLNDTTASADSWLRNGAGAPVYGGSLNIGGYAYTVAPSAFSNGVYRFRERHWLNAVTASGALGAAFDWRLVLSDYRYDQDEQRAPSTILPGALAGGAGAITRMDGTGWRTADLSAAWRPDDRQEIRFGLHAEAYRLESRRFNTADWIAGAPTTLAAVSLGRTRTDAVWAQDQVSLAPGWRLTLGGRGEHWEASDGFNFSASPALAVSQPALSANRFSPKASLRWSDGGPWSVTVSAGEAWRFPTVGELYQAITTGVTLTVPNPDLKPERALSTETAVEWRDGAGRVRLSLFTEDVSDALISQTAPLVPGSPTLFSYVQNVDRVRSRGAELAFERQDLLVQGLSLSGSVTYVDARVRRDGAFPAAQGKRLPQVPRWRATLVATWRPARPLAFTLAARYADRSYGTIDNSDVFAHAYQGFDGYLVADARAAWQVTDRWSLAAGADNLGGRDYFVFHPFPQRTAYAELRYAF